MEISIILAIIAIFIANHNERVDKKIYIEIRTKIERIINGLYPGVISIPDNIIGNENNRIIRMIIILGLKIKIMIYIILKFYTYRKNIRCPYCDGKKEKQHISINYNDGTDNITYRDCEKCYRDGILSIISKKGDPDPVYIVRDKSILNSGVCWF